MIEPRARWQRAISAVEPIDRHAIDAARTHHDRLTKPPGSLGRLEDLAAQLCGIQRTTRPRSADREIAIFAADHGVAAENVSAYPAAVTPQMVANFTRGGAAINALARSVNARVRVIDVGVNGRTAADGSCAGLVDAKVRSGSGNIACEPAMSEQELWQALGIGLEHAERAADEGVAVLGLGEMGIGNSTAASALTAALTGRTPADVTGRGTGLDAKGLAHKIGVVDRALACHSPAADRPLEALRLVGGLEIAALSGVVVGAAANRITVVTDGFIATSAVLAAVAACPPTAGYVIAAHRSPEPGHSVQLEHLGLEPLLDLRMRLGEGTGAALAMSLIDAACRAFNEMATFESAGVSEH